jgi:hypothetical protein
VKEEGGSDKQNVALVGKRKDKKKDMSKLKCFACHKTDDYASQCPNKKKKKQELEVSASTEVVEFAEKFEREFSLMTGMRPVFLSLSEIDSDCFVDSGANSQLAVKGVGSVRFQLESGGGRGVVYSRDDSKLALSVSFGD